MRRILGAAVGLLILVLLSAGCDRRRNEVPTKIEPLPKEHPLWPAPNAILTPHVADRGPDLDPARVAVISENARRFAAGQPLLNVVDKANWF